MIYLTYFRTAVIKDGREFMIKVMYFNGSYNRANNVSPKDIGQVGNAIIMASNEGSPYRGKPVDMARDAIRHINGQLSYYIGAFPVVLDSKSGTDNKGRVYTTEIVFQVVF